MALSLPPRTVASEEDEFKIESPLFVATMSERGIHELRRKQHLTPGPSFDTGNGFFLGDGPFQWKDHVDKIEYLGFSFDRPWLPPNALKLLDKIKKRPISETEMMKLMGLVAEQASLHFQLDEDKNVAMTFHGQIVEVSDTRVGLLKKIQGRKYREQIFVWRVGSDVLSGRK